MTIRPKNSKQEILSNVLSDIIDEFFSQQRGIVIPATNIILKDYLKKADENKEGGPSIYYLIQALAEMAKGNIQAAEKFCSNATRLDPNHPTIMSNYATILYLLGRHEEVKKIVKKLFDEKNVSPKRDSAVSTNLMHSSLVTLDTSYYESSNAISTINGWNDVVDYIKRIKNDLHEVDISSNEHTEFMEQLELFLFVKTRQMAAYRLSIENGLDRYLKIEVFLDINADEASYLNSEFTTHFVDYVFDKDRHDLLGKFVVFFKQNESRHDGTENSDALYLGMNEELVA
ncbi:MULTISPECIES: tetratricopeptide repeat protein [unclassified Psychrobacter]|uniref:tetratricopeptide repeat protein n=1 Tax=unclassified Psychrobacter TaxID=196806 RepID=UPI0007137005|nr:tetratricopeptide repeat protein [Psychrobacter sp. P11F6]KRG34230.1 hypothetical protein AK822_04795 [Psychrobacter sp. P11F6]